jgi:hypothetical protein
MTTYYAAVEIEANDAAEALEQIESIGEMISIGLNPKFVFGE